MAKKLQLTITEPCHENWDGMTPVEKGKFCGSCQKQVVDFSDMSDRQVAEFFKKPSTGSVCGRFMTDQLDRPIEIPRKRIPWVKYFFQIALPAFLVSMKVSAQKTHGTVKVATKGTTKPPVINDYQTMGMVVLPMDLEPFIKDTIVKPVKEPVVMMKGDISVAFDTAVAPPVCSREIMGKIAMPISLNTNHIEGIVLNEKGEPVPFASIETGKPGEGVMADENGIFSIKKNWLNNVAGFIVSSTGYESRKVITGEEVYKQGKLFVQLKSNVVLPEVVISATGITGRVRYTLGGISSVISQTINVIENKENMPGKEIKSPADENRLIVFPNPVQSGATLNLSFKKLEEGYYQFQILNQSGQMVQQKEIWAAAEARLLNINIPVVAAGSYVLVLANKKTGKKFMEKIIIQ
jgi:CarboxypepD_reg-like domain/Secretion system C-terminal sorting domain